MQRLLFILTLALYGFSAMDLHEWAHVPEVMMHMVEHHSDLGHDHGDNTEHDHEDDGDHDPFGHEDHEACCASSLVSLVYESYSFSAVAEMSTSTLIPSEKKMALSAFSGSIWNPPKLV